MEEKKQTATLTQAIVAERRKIKALVTLQRAEASLRENIMLGNALGCYTVGSCALGEARDLLTDVNAWLDGKHDDEIKRDYRMEGNACGYTVVIEDDIEDDKKEVEPTAETVKIEMPAEVAEPPFAFHEEGPEYEALHAKAYDVAKRHAVVMTGLYPSFPPNAEISVEEGVLRMLSQTYLESKALWGEMRRCGGLADVAIHSGSQDLVDRLPQDIVECVSKALGETVCKHNGLNPIVRLQNKRTNEVIGDAANASEQAKRDNALWAPVDTYIDGIFSSCRTLTGTEKTLIAGNIRSFASSFYVPLKQVNEALIAQDAEIKKALLKATNENAQLTSFLVVTKEKFTREAEHYIVGSALEDNRRHANKCDGCATDKWFIVGLPAAVTRAERRNELLTEIVAHLPTHTAALDDLATPLAEHMESRDWNLLRGALIRWRNFIDEQRQKGLT